MTKSELLEKFDQVQSSIGGWGLALGYLTKVGFVLGCYFDQGLNKWTIYETDERGIEEVTSRADSEEGAYEKLYKLIMIHNEINTGRF